MDSTDGYRIYRELDLLNDKVDGLSDKVDTLIGLLRDLRSLGLYHIANPEPGFNGLMMEIRKETADVTDRT